MRHVNQYKMCILLPIKVLIILYVISLNAFAQRVLNGSLEQYSFYSLPSCHSYQDSIIFSNHVSNVTVFLEKSGFQDANTIGANSRYHYFLDTNCFNYSNQVFINRLDGNAWLSLNTIWRYCSPPNNTSLHYPKYNFKLSSPLITNKLYLIRFSTHIVTSQQELYFGFSKYDDNKGRNFIYKQIDSGLWRPHAFIYTPDSNYSYITIARENRPMPNCYNALPGCLFDNLILDTCVQIGTTQTVSVSPCQSAFPITLQSNRLHGSMYFWSNNDTLPNTVVSDTGKYLSFVYDSIGCAVIDSFVVQYDTALTVGKKNDVLKCSNASITLLADTGASWYEWNTGATTRVIFVSDTGLYWVKSKKNNCIRIDTFVVKPYAVSSIFTVSQRKVCNLAIATLDATHPQYNRYMWSTGDTTSTITVSQTGIYYVTAIDSICNITDSVQVFILNQTSETIDTGICAQTSITLQARIADSYLWSTGDTTQQVTTQQIGKYFVKRTIQQCELTDTFTVENYPTPSNVSFDSIICKGTSLILQAQSATSYQWNTGQQTPSITVFDAGIYQVIKTIPPCTGTETFNVSTYPLPQITSVQDTTVCFDEVKQILLDAGQFAKYLWEPTGETTRTIYSNTAQIYKLTVTDSNTCVSSKAFAVMEECPYSLYIPNAFTPNNDGTNDELVIKGNRIDAFEMMIINRWGQIIYETDRMNQYWDGANCETGVYVIYIKYSAINKNYTYKGTVSLIR